MLEERRARAHADLGLGVRLDVAFDIHVPEQLAQLVKHADTIVNAQVPAQEALREVLGRLKLLQVALRQPVVDELGDLEL